jgi:cysteinyl-tRNA synthetase
MKLYNTLSGKKEDFEPLDGKTVRVYVCGMTLQDSPHLGHLRVFTVFDTLYRLFKILGWEVKAVQNFTDIDDKIIKKSEEEGIDWRIITERYEVEYRDVARKMNFLPIYHPRATQHIQEIIEMINSIIERGYAYVRDGNVWFSVKKFLKDYDYGVLSKMPLEELQAGARVEVDPTKEDPLDFALWKAKKEGEPYWESPWGKGRPGWHIECSAMSSTHLGLPFDIHGGGRDLIFPHHENEIAQTKGATGKDFARFWIHVGLLTVSGEKMSKSLKNYFLAREALADFHPSAIRLMLLSGHYRNDLEFYPEKLTEFSKSWARIYESLSIVEGEIVSALWEELLEILKDDLDTPEFFAQIFKNLESKDKNVLYTLRVLLEKLGFSFEKEGEEIVLRRLIGIREMARKERNYELADKIREVLKLAGVEIMDTPEGTKFRIG